MTKPFKFRYVHELTGAFVFIAICLLFLGIFFAARIQGWFEPNVMFRTLFSTKEGAYGLETGGDIIILNTRAGNIASIKPNKKGNLEAHLKIKQAFHKFVRKDSVAVVKKKFALAGDAYLEILPGDFEKPQLREGSYLKTSKDMEIMETVNEVLEDFKEGFMPAIEKLKIVLEKLPELQDQTNKTFKEAELLMKEIRGNGIPVLKDLKTLFSNLSEYVKKLETILTGIEKVILEINNENEPVIKNLNQMLMEGKNALSSLDEIIKSVNGEEIEDFIEDLPEVTRDIKERLNDVEEVLVGFKKHWLLRKYVNEKEFEYNISPFLPELSQDEK